MALRAADFAQFLPQASGPTDGAQAFSQSMRNLETSRQARAHEQANKLAFREQQWQFDEQQRMQAEQIAAQKNKDQQLAIADIYKNSRSDNPALLQGAIHGLRAHGLDAQLEDGTAPDASSAIPGAPEAAATPAAPATPDALAAVDDALNAAELANPAAAAPEVPPAPDEPATLAEPAAPVATPGEQSIVIRRNGEVVARIPVADLSEPPKDFIRKNFASAAASDIPISAPMQERDYTSFLDASEGDAVLALKLANEERDRRIKAAQDELNREAALRAAQSSSARGGAALSDSGYERGQRIAAKFVASHGVDQTLKNYQQHRELMELIKTNPGDTILIAQMMFNLAKANQPVGVLTDQDLAISTGTRSVFDNIMLQASKWMTGEIPAAEVQRYLKVLVPQGQQWAKKVVRGYDALNRQVDTMPSQSMRDGGRAQLLMFETYVPEFFADGGPLSSRSARRAAPRRRPGGGGPTPGKPPGGGGSRGKKLINDLYGR